MIGLVIVVVGVVHSVGTAVAAPGDEAAAQAVARQTSEPVLIAGKTTQTEEFYANPDGSFTYRQHERPVRVRQDGEWTAVDTTLVSRPDGTIAPRAAAVGISFSGGGAGSAGTPFTRLAYQGNEVGLTWAADLPKPVLDGASATYADVLPGVDLKVTAEVLGFSQVLVVKTAEAARDPRLEKITFGSHTRNTRVRSTNSDLEVVDAAGKVFFTGDATRMWDSGARSAVMGTEVTEQSLSILPDQGFLADSATKYPVYLDPDYSCAVCGKAHHVVVQSGFPSAKNYDVTTGDLNDLKAGWQNNDSSGISQTYVEMFTGALAGKTIKWASLNTTLQYSWHPDASATPTELYLANAFGPGTDWNHRPGPVNIPGVQAFQSSSNVTNQFSAPNVSMQFGATGAVTYAAANGLGSLAFLLKGSHEGDTTSWRRFALNPYLEVHYNSTPNNPVGHAMQNGTVPCVTGSRRPWIATRTPIVQARVSDPDGGGLGVQAATIGGSYGADVPGTYHDNSGALTWVGTPGPNQQALAKYQIPPGWITSDGIYKWTMRVTDGELTSPRWDWDCEFYVDTSVPPGPTITPTGTTPVNQGDTATFALYVPVGSSGPVNITRFIYTTDGSEPSTQGSPSVAANPLVEAGGGTKAYFASFTTSATNANQNLIKVRAVNRAGTPGLDGTCVAPLTTVGTACAYTVAPLTSAKFLKGAWAIDDTSGTVATDQVATLNPGETAHPLNLRGGAVWALGYNRGNSWTQADAFGAKQGKRGGMYLTNGGYLETSKVIDTSSSFSVAAWVNLANTNSYATVASQDGNQVSGFFLQYSADVGKWTFSTTPTDAVTDTTTRTTSADNTAVPRLNTWTHLVGTYDATTRQVSLYVDGKRVGTRVLDAPLWNATGSFVVGGAKWNSGRVDLFPGLVDDVQAWQRALSQQDVHDLASVSVPRASFGLAEGAGTKLTTGAIGSELTGDYVPAPVPALHGYWKFDEGTGTTVLDASNNGAGYENNLITTNASWVTGKTGSALRYSGTAGSYSYSTNQAVDTSQSFTVSAWATLEDPTTFQGVVGQSGPNKPAFQMRYSPDVKSWIFGVNRSDAANTVTDWAYKLNSVTTTGSWTQLTGVYDNDTKQVQLYVDGKLAGATEYKGVPWNATGHVTVGAYDYAGNPMHFFTGAIDNVQIWQRALTASQVAGMAGVSYVDDVWNLTQTTGTPAGSVSQTADADGAYTSFPGTTGTRVTWPRPTFFRTDSSFSIEAWVRADDLAGSAATAVSFADGDKTPVALEYRPDWGGRWTFLLSDSRVVVSDDGPVQGEWAHLAGTYDAATGQACFYVDGQLQNTEIGASGPQTVQGCSTGVVSRDNAGVVAAGTGYANGGQLVNPWHGGLAGIRLYSGVRTANQIKDDRTADDPGALFETRH